MAKRKMPDKYQPWIEARKRFHLSHTHIQMARELGLNPKKFGGLANTKKTLEIALTGVSQRAIFQTPQEAAAREHALHRTDGER